MKDQEIKLNKGFVLQTEKHLKELDNDIDDFLSHELSIVTKIDDKMVRLINKDGQTVYEEKYEGNFNFSKFWSRASKLVDSNIMLTIDIRKSADYINTVIEFPVKVVAFVDDNEQLLKTSKEQLELMGHYIEIFSDPIKARNRITKHPKLFDKIILDQKMPQLSGSRLARELLSKFPFLRINLFTGNSSEVTVFRDTPFPTFTKDGSITVGDMLGRRAT